MYIVRFVPSLYEFGERRSGPGVSLCPMALSMADIQSLGYMYFSLENYYIKNKC